MVNYFKAIKDIRAGGIFYAEAADGSRLVCLATSVERTTIYAKSITTQIYITFNRQTGEGTWGNFDPIPCYIKSVTPLPKDVRDVILELESKYNHKQTSENYQLSEEEQKALLFLYPFYSINQLPPSE